MAGVRDHFLERIWSGQGNWITSAARIFLHLLSALFGAGVTSRLFFYRIGLRKRETLPCPVLSVGNITLGGTGKTPMVEYLYRRLSKERKNVVVLSRGYGRKKRETNEEYLLLQENLGRIEHLQGKDRVRLGREAWERFHPSSVILDDGFQHLRLKRDLDIVLLDALNPFGYGHLFPRGLLREPLGGLRRAHLFVLTRTDGIAREDVELLRKKLAEKVPGVPVVEAVHRPKSLHLLPGGEERPLQEMVNRKVFLFAGIGNFEGFKTTAESLGAHIVGWQAYPDHYPYRQEDPLRIAEEAGKEGAEQVLTTQKDAVKLRFIKRFEGKRSLPFLFLKVAMEITKGEDALTGLLKKKGFL